MPMPRRRAPRAGPGVRRRGLGVPLAALAHARPRRIARIALLCVAIGAPLLAGGWLWLRGSSLVAVSDVHVSGLHGPEAPAIEAALTDAARHMTTLEVNPAELRAAVAAFPVVSALHASASFPHGLRITVFERPPVAALVVGGARTAVAANGVALGPALLSSALPSVAASFLPSPGERVPGWRQLDALALLGSAPAALARHVSSVYVGPRGITAAMRNGLLVYFGDTTLPHAKWLSLTRVLSDPSSAGASYIDVRLPSRPAAGLPEGLAPSASRAGASEGTGEAPSALPSEGQAGESTVGALAAGLASGAGSGSSAQGQAGAAAGTGTQAGQGAEPSSSTPGGSSSAASEASAGESSPRARAPGEASSGGG